MALPFLPPEHIRPAFSELNDQATEYGIDSLLELTSYINSTWISSSLWTPENWSAFRETVRTNNDVEGKYSAFYK